MLKKIKALLNGITKGRKKQNSSESSKWYEDKVKAPTLEEKEQIEGTPFWLNKTKEQGWFITMKGYKLTRGYEHRDDAMKELWMENNGWNIMANMCVIIHEEIANEAAKLFEKRQKEAEEILSVPIKGFGDNSLLRTKD